MSDTRNRGVADIGVPKGRKVGASAARELVKFIIDTGLQPGTALPPERELAELLRIGRGTTREALRILETFGVVEMRTGRYGGPVVRKPDAANLSASLTLAFFVQGISMLDVLEARLATEPVLAELAAKRITPDEIDQLQETVRQMQMPSSSEATYLASAEEFHNLVAQAARAPALQLLVAGLQKIGGGESVGIFYPVPQRLATARAHKRIIDALKNKDAEGAKWLWQEHLREARDYWTKKFPEAAQNPVAWSL
jgi:GntR family transcriptional regulator, transcriptional repressor for pyruvate dehydrogenase complex